MPRGERERGEKEREREKNRGVRTHPWWTPVLMMHVDEGGLILLSVGSGLPRLRKVLDVTVLVTVTKSTIISTGPLFITLQMRGPCIRY